MDFIEDFAFVEKAIPFFKKFPREKEITTTAEISVICRQVDGLPKNSADVYHFMSILAYYGFIKKTRKSEYRVDAAKIKTLLEKGEQRWKERLLKY